MKNIDDGRLMIGDWTDTVPGSGFVFFNRQSSRRSAELSRSLVNRHSQSGFTLIELLVVIAIIGILAATIIPRFSGRTQEAKLTAAKDAVHTIGTQLDTYESDSGVYPSTAQGLQALIEKPSGEPEASNWKGPYLKRDAELRDPWGNDYVYRSPGDRNPESYDIFSNGPDKKEGTEDDITNWAARK